MKKKIYLRLKLIYIETDIIQYAILYYVNVSIHINSNFITVNVNW